MATAALLRKIAEGDERAFKDFFDRYYGRLFDAALFFTRDRFSAEEVVSSVFIKFWNNRHVPYDAEGLNAYLYTAVKRQSLNYLRNNKKHNHQQIEEIRSEIFVEAKMPDQEIISVEFLNALNLAIEKLPFKCRLVYQMVKEDGMKYKEVASAMNISVKAVEMHIGKALKRIRSELTSFHPSRSFIKSN